MNDIETIAVPDRFVALADKRTRAIVLASVHFPDALRTIARSCYLQGLEDGASAGVKAESQREP